MHRSGEEPQLGLAAEKHKRKEQEPGQPKKSIFKNKVKFSFLDMILALWLIKSKALLCAEAS